MKAWRNIEKHYKIVLYLAIIVVYSFFLDNFYDLGSKSIPVKPGFTMKFVAPGIGDYLRTFTGYYSWFLIAVLGYFSRSKFDGMMVGFTFWLPWLFWALFSDHWSLRPFGGQVSLFPPFLLPLISLPGAAVGMVFGFIGSRRRKDKSKGEES